MVNTRSSPVISKILVMLRSLHTSDSWPSFVRNRLTPPTRTPSVVESMNVVSLKSTITCFPPWPMTSRSCCLNSGAVYRSTSPASEITYASSPNCSVLMSKFIVPRGLWSAGLFPSARSLTPGGLPQGLDPCADLRGRGGVELELEQAHVCADRHRRLAQCVRRLGEGKDRLLVVRAQLDDPLVRRNGRRGRGLVLGGHFLQLGARLGREGGRDRILAEGLSELAAGRRREGGAD